MKKISLFLIFFLFLFSSKKAGVNLLESFSVISLSHTSITYSADFKPSSGNSVTSARLIINGKLYPVSTYSGTHTISISSDVYFGKNNSVKIYADFSHGSSVSGALSNVMSSTGSPINMNIRVSPDELLGLNPHDNVVFNIGNDYGVTDYKYSINGEEYSEAIPFAQEFRLNDQFPDKELCVGQYEVSFIAGHNGIFIKEARARKYIITVTAKNYVKSTTLLKPQLGSVSNAELAALPRSVVSKSISFSDAMGRADQSIAIGASNTGKDIVSHVEYDERGIQSKTHLPYVSWNADGWYKKNAKNEQKSYYAGEGFDESRKIVRTNYPYSETVVEKSPLNRTLEQASIGKNWRVGSGRTIKTKTYANTEAIGSWNEIGEFQADLFAPNTLIITETTDENGNSSYEYKDKADKTIIKKSRNISYKLSFEPKYFSYNSGSHGDLNFSKTDVHDFWAEKTETVTASLQISVEYIFSGWIVPASIELYELEGNTEKFLYRIGTYEQIESTNISNDFDAYEQIESTNISNDFDAYEQIESTNISNDFDELDELDEFDELDELDLIRSSTSKNYNWELKKGKKYRIKLSYNRKLSEKSSASVTLTRSVEKIIETGSSDVLTHYVYDKFGNLKYIVPPEAVKELGTNSLIHDKNIPVPKKKTFSYGGIDDGLKSKSFTFVADYTETVSIHFSLSGHARGGASLHPVSASLYSYSEGKNLASLVGYDNIEHTKRVEKGRKYVSAYGRGSSSRKITLRKGYKYLISLYYYSDSNSHSSVNATIKRSVRTEKTIPDIGNYTDIAKKWVTRFNYDSENRLIEKWTPEAGSVYTVYDKLGRAVMTQDENLAKKDQWLFTKYDLHGRVIYTGISTYSNGSDRKGKKDNLQAKLNTESIFYEKVDPSEELGYTTDNSLSFLPEITMNQILSVSYYDNYENPVTKDKDYTSEVYGVKPTKYRLRGKVTATKTRILPGGDITEGNFAFPIENENISLGANETAQLSNGTEDILILPETLLEVGNGAELIIAPNMKTTLENVKPEFLSAYSLYDKKGRVIKSVSENYVGGTDISESKYDWAGKVLKSRSVHRDENGLESQVISTPVYDGLNRAVFSKEKRRFKGTEIPGERIASISHFNELGEVYETFIQPSINDISKDEKTGIYSFNSANKNYLYKVEHRKNIRGWLTKIHVTDNKGETLFMEDLAYNSGEFSKPQYNGNISGVGITQKSSNTTKKYTYGYIYDDLNQLLSATYKSIENAAGDFSTDKLVYDLNGNIKELWRKKDANAYIDKLLYSYKGNKIQSISDAMGDDTNIGNDFGANSATYEYDENGNMTFDSGKNISISYNHLNLPYLIDFNDGMKIVYTYLADGSKVARIKKNEGLFERTRYAGAYVYEENAKDETNLDFVSTGGGRFKDGKFEYFLKDHLGNTRTVVKKEENSYNYSMVQDNHYYAFGLKIENLSSNAVPGANRYTYNGKEIDRDLNWLHYGARFYDPAVGRWWVTDAADQYNSPYSYVGSSPILFLDKDGNWANPPSWMRYGFLSRLGYIFSGLNQVGQEKVPNKEETVRFLIVVDKGLQKTSDHATNLGHIALGSALVTGGATIPAAKTFYGVAATTEAASVVVRVVIYILDEKGSDEAANKISKSAIKNGAGAVIDKIVPKMPAESAVEETLKQVVSPLIDKKIDKFINSDEYKKNMETDSEKTKVED
jgi:RHS repeat-associated protein